MDTSTLQKLDELDIFYNQQNHNIGVTKCDKVFCAYYFKDLITDYIASGKPNLATHPEIVKLLNYKLKAEVDKLGYQKTQNENSLKYLFKINNAIEALKEQAENSEVFECILSHTTREKYNKSKYNLSELTKTTYTATDLQKVAKDLEKMKQQSIVSYRSSNKKARQHSLDSWAEVLKEKSKQSQM